MSTSPFAGLTGQPLHHAVLEVRGRHARTEYELMQALVAVDSTGLHRQMRCATVVDYGSRFLHLDPQKASELLRVGRLLPKHPHLAKVLEEGKLHWSKIREITRVMTAENEERLIDYAKSHLSHEVQRMIACRPRRAGELVAPARTGPAVAPPAADSGGAASTTAKPNPASPAPVQKDLFGSPVATPKAEEPPVKPSEILYEMRLTPFRWAKQEQVLNRLRSQMGYHASRAAVQERMCDIVLSSGEVRTQIRYQVYLHVDGITGEAWLDTDRGFLPAPPEVVDEALATGRVKVVSRTGSAPAVSAWPNSWSTVSVPHEPNEAAVLTETVPEAPGEAAPGRRPHGRPRKKIPVAVLRQVLEETEGRCVGCGRRMRSQINHRDEPYSEVPEHHPAAMDTRCDDCHKMFHLDDFRLRPGWKEARDRALRRREASRAAGAPDST